jgi:putative photosynthetic complex assembly protein
MNSSVMDTAVRRDTGARRRPGGAPASRSRGKIPLPPLIALSMVASIGIIGMLPGTKDDHAKPIAHRSLLVATASDETTVIRDGSTNRVIADLPGNVDSFVRGVFHSLNVNRRLHGVPPSTPYQLSELTNGRVLLTDEATATTIDLEGFGAKSASTFTALLDLPPLKSPE